MNFEKPNSSHFDEDNTEEEDPPNYGDVSYWDSRYEIPEDFDWYQNWTDLAPAFDLFFAGDEVVLNIGCGNSRMSYEMSMSSPIQKVVSIDFSSNVINQMKQKYSQNSKLEWMVMDCTKMTFPDNSFDMVFDKGTVDCIFCSDSPIESVYNTLSEVERVLKTGGLFFLISYSKPESRVYIFKQIKLHWHLHQPMILPNPQKEHSYHYVYIFQKLNPEIDIRLFHDEVEYDFEEEEEEEEEFEEEESIQTHS